MGEEDAFDAMAQGCIANHENITRHGSPEMQAASRMLLYARALEIRRCEKAQAMEAEDA
jgi:hypothetical protein